MRRHLTGLVLLLTFSGSLCLAQTIQPAEVDDFKPASSNQPGRQYPQVNSEGRARIRIIAPEALKLLFISTGERDHSFEYTQKTVNTFKEHGLDVENSTFPGAHEWHVWRKALHDFTPRIFH